MTSQPTRDPAKDQLLTPQNSALVIIDYQPVQVTSAGELVEIPVAIEGRRQRTPL